MKLEQIQVVVSGRVQGVGFRYSTVSQAEKLGVTGWVRNLPDGTVEALAEGTTDQIEAFLVWCRQGPPGSRVDRVDVKIRTEIPARNSKSFITERA